MNLRITKCCGVKNNINAYFINKMLILTVKLKGAFFYGRKKEVHNY